MNGIETHVWHFIATGGGGMLATLLAVWRMFVVPAREKELANERWKVQVEARLASGEKLFAGHKEQDSAILAKLEAIEERLRAIEIRLGGQQ